MEGGEDVEILAGTGWIAERTFDKHRDTVIELIYFVSNRLIGKGDSRPCTNPCDLFNVAGQISRWENEDANERSACIN